MQTVLPKIIWPAGDLTKIFGKEIPVYSEEMEGPGAFIVAVSMERMIAIQTKNGLNRQTFNAFWIKPYYRDYFNNVLAFKSFWDAVWPLFQVHSTQVVEQQDPQS